MKNIIIYRPCQCSQRLRIGLLKKKRKSRDISFRHLNFFLSHNRDFLGRVLRGKTDYGIMILADKRFSRWGAHKFSPVFSLFFPFLGGRSRRFSRWGAHKFVISFSLFFLFLGGRSRRFTRWDAHKFSPHFLLLSLSLSCFSS